MYDNSWYLHTARYIMLIIWMRMIISLKKETEWKLFCLSLCLSDWKEYKTLLYFSGFLVKMLLHFLLNVLYYYSSLLVWIRRKGISSRRQTSKRKRIRCSIQPLFPYHKPTIRVMIFPTISLLPAQYSSKTCHTNTFCYFVLKSLYIFLYYVYSERSHFKWW